MKLHALWTDPNPPLSFFVSPRWQLGIIEAEGLLGLWLVSGLFPCGAWLAALATFVGFAGASLYLATIGQPSCGCFGKLPVNPWYTFGLDVTAVAALCCWQPRPSPLRLLVPPFHAGPLRPAFFAVCGAAIVPLVGYAALWALGPSAPGALAHLRGESILVKPEVADVGSAAAGEVRTFSIQVWNYTDHPIRITGGTVDCTCIATGDLPVTVPAQESRTLRVQLGLRGRPGVLQRPFELYTDDPAQPRLVARVVGRVVESPQR